MLTSDQLGAKGESRFRELCADAGLICNQSDRDRAGWDFIVEGSYEEIDGTSYDKRATPLACHVQVKTVARNAKPIQMKLNMAERLAKELKPAFVCIFVVAPDLQIIEAYLIHIIGDRLASILKTLRRHTATNDARPLNKVKLSFAPAATERFNPDGQGLKEAFQAAIGPLLFKYSSEKEQQIQSLGYEDKRYRGTITLPNDPIELSDMLLGLKPSTARNFQTFEKRFGIEIPEHSAEDVVMQITPQPRDKCRITLRGAEGTIPVFFDGDVYLASSQLTGGANRFYIKSQFLKIDITQSPGSEIKFEIPPPKLAGLADWITYWEMIERLSTLPCVVEVKIHSNPPRPPLPLPLSAPISLPYPEPPSSCISYARRLEHIFRICAESIAEEIDWVDVEIAYGDIALLSEALNNETLDLSFSVDTLKLAALSTPTKTIICNKFKIAGTTVGYILSANLLVEHQTGQVKLSEIKFGHTTKIGPEDTDFEAFREWGKIQHGVESACYVHATSKWNL